MTVAQVKAEISQRDIWEMIDLLDEDDWDNSEATWGQITALTNRAIAAGWVKA